MYIKVRVPGSAGEIAQGWRYVWQTMQPYLVTCPVARYTTVEIYDDIIGLNGVGRKAGIAMACMLTRFGQRTLPGGCGIRLRSELPRSKGMASSSADIAAVAAAVSLACGKEPDVEEIMHIATAIEPTDGVFWPGIVELNYRTGEIFDQFRGLPPVPLTVLDFGGSVDTVRFHIENDDDETYPSPDDMRSSLEYIENFMHSAVLDESVAGAQLSRYLKLMDSPARPRNMTLPRPLMRKLREMGCMDASGAPRAGVDYRAVAVALAAAVDGLLHQPRHLIDDFLALLDVVIDIGALGMTIAHSGTVVGLIWPMESTSGQRSAGVQRLLTAYPQLSLLTDTHIVSGGIEILANERSYLA